MGGVPAARGGFTVGARLRASQSTNKVDSAFFTTRLAVGNELYLLDETRTPLSSKPWRKRSVTRAGYTERGGAPFGGPGNVVPWFGADRYASVVNALLALRKEKLSQDLDPEKLSGVLTERSLRSTIRMSPFSLRALNASIVAEANGALERDLTEVKALARQQREYARAIVVSAARNARSAETHRDGVTRAEREARESLEAADNRAARSTRNADARERFTAIGVEIDAFKDSDAYRAGAGLADLRRLAEHAAAGAEQASRAAAQRQAEHAATAGEAGVATSECAVAASNLDLAERDLRAAAEPAGASAVVDGGSLDGGRRRSGALGPSLGAKNARASTRCAHGSTRTTMRSRPATSSTSRSRPTNAPSTSACRRRPRRTRRCTPPRPLTRRPSPSGVAAASTSAPNSRATFRPRRTTRTPSWLWPPPRSLPAYARRSPERGRPSRRPATPPRPNALHSWSNANVGSTVDSSTPHWLSWRSGRSGLPGGPLWRLVDVRPETAPYDVDALEAALTVPRSVYAWGARRRHRRVGPERADVVLGTRPAAGETLADLLFPAQGGAVAAGIVHSVLASIPVCATAA